MQSAVFTSSLDGKVVSNGRLDVKALLDLCAATCNGVDECPDSPNSCMQRTCTGGFCGFAPNVDATCDDGDSCTTTNDQCDDSGSCKGTYDDLLDGCPTMAIYDAPAQCPCCHDPSSGCDSGTLLIGRGTVGPEDHHSNTIGGGCSDGTSGTFHNDESIDKIAVRTLDGSNFAKGKPVEIKARVWAWSTGSQDTADFYYAPDSENPNWTHIASITPPAGGAQDLTAQCTLPEGGLLQAVRVNFRYQGSASECSTGSYDDTDDLVFAVSTTSKFAHMWFLIV